MVNDAPRTVSTDIQSFRPGMRALVALVRAEARMVMRDTGGLVVPLGLPLLILVMQGMSITDTTLPDGRNIIDVYVLPVVALIVIATIGVINMPSFLAMYRRGGVLARLQVTPVSPMLVLIAQVIVSLLQTLVGITIAFAVAIALYDASLPSAPLLSAGVFLLVAAAIYTMGMMIAAVSPTPNSSVAIGLVAFFAMAAIGGMFGPVENLPETVARIGSVLPFGAGVEALSSAWNGDTPDLRSVIALAVAVVVPSAVAARWFRWT